jgi:hypothetical protein
MTITPGTRFTVDAANASRVKVDRLDDDNVICGYMDGSNLDVFSVVIQSDETVGTKFTHLLSDGQGVTVAALSATKAILAYADVSASDEVRAVILNISGTTITTPGSELSLGFNGASSTMDIVALSSTSAIFVVEDDTTTNNGVALYLTISGNTITNESNATFDSGDIDVPRLAFVSSTKAVVVYVETGTTQVKAAVLSVSGTTISAGTPITLDSADTTSAPTIAKISSSAVLVGYRNITDGNNKAVVLSISGTTLTENAAEIVNNVSTNNRALAAYTATKFALSYRGGGQYNVAELTVSGITVTADTAIFQNAGNVNAAMSSVAFTNSLAININRSSTNGTLLTLEALFTGQRALVQAVDQESGSIIYLTSWEDGTLFLYNRALSDLSETSKANFGAAAASALVSRSNYISPYTPLFPDIASFGDYVYAFGRWDDGSVKHLALSTSAGGTGTFGSNLGDASWGSDWVGAFFADDPTTLYAFVNGSSRALWRSEDSGSTWSSLSSLPFDVDPGGAVKHPDGRILIINRESGSQMAAIAQSPNYSSWIDATGAPAFPQSGGGARSVKWVV